MRKAVILLLFIFLVSALFLWGKERKNKTGRVESASFPLPTPNVIYDRGSKEKKEIALTFDADMTEGMKKRLLSGRVSSWYNREVINELVATGTPATLFLTGMWIELYPEVTRELALNPLFELGNHSYSHPSFSGYCFRLRQIPDSQDEAEIEKTQRLLKEVAGVDNKFFRFPGGCFDKFDIETVTRLGLKIVEWDVESRDAFNPDKKAIVRRVLSRVQNGSIVVFHLHGGHNAPATALALPEIISGLKKEGYSLVKVSQLIEF